MDRAITSFTFGYIDTVDLIGRSMLMTRRNYELPLRRWPRLEDAFSIIIGGAMRVVFGENVQRTENDLLVDPVRARISRLRKRHPQVRESACTCTCCTRIPNSGKPLDRIR